MQKSLSIVSEQPQTFKLSPAVRDQSTHVLVADSPGMYCESQLDSCCE